jgi:hypothetical protein
MADDDMVLMTHPDHLPDTPPTETTEFAFRNSWEPKGWQRAEEPAGATDVTPENEPRSSPPRAPRPKRRPT